MQKFPRCLACAALAAGIVTTGCRAEPPPVTAVLDGFEDRAPLGGFTLVDERPPQDKVRDRGSVWITSCSFGIAQYGDEATLPSKIALLRRDLEDGLGSRLSGVTLTVKRYKIVFNANWAAVKFAEGEPVKLGPALVGAALTPSRCPEFDYQRLEVATDNSPLIVEIAVRLGDSDYAVRVVQSLDKEYFELGKGYPGFNPPDNAPVLLAAMRKAHAALIEKLKPALTP